MDWIPCKDKMPEDDERYKGKKIINVLVTTSTNKVTKVQRKHHKNYDGTYNGWYWGRVYGECKAWMPLPEPYKEEE